MTPTDSFSREAIVLAAKKISLVVIIALDNFLIKNEKLLNFTEVIHFHHLFSLYVQFKNKILSR